MKYTLPLLLLLAGGCSSVRTLAPEDFLYAFRCGVMPGELAANSSATYVSRDAAYHYVDLRNGRPTDVFLGDLSGTQKIRCMVNLLPSDFPNGFEPLRGGEGFENSEDTRQYVKDYLARHRRDRPDGKEIHDSGSD
jgi:hypothetical protein